MADATIVEFTDPGCPFAYSTEPTKRRLQWLYGDHLEWTPRMVVVSESEQEYLDKGFDPPMQVKAFTMLSERYGMPMVLDERLRMAGTVPACRAVVAARLNAPERLEPLLRALRICHFEGRLLDEDATLDHAAKIAGVELAPDDGADAALREDMDAARHPSPVGRVLDSKLANWSGGRRYGTPSYEITVDDRTVTIPGFFDFTVYEVVFANLLPEVSRRDTPGSVGEVLEWTDMPLATQEVAVVCGVSRDEARAELQKTADEHPFGTDAFWT